MILVGGGGKKKLCYNLEDIAVEKMTPNFACKEYLGC